MKIALFSYTGRGGRLRKKLERQLAAVLGVELAAGLTPEEAFGSCDALIFIAAAGIAVRKIAPSVRDKFTDPAVLSIDECGQYCVPLLSGHVGGGNALARRVSALIGAVPVISTATDLNGVFAVDLFAVRNQLIISDRRLAKEISAALLRGEPVGFFSEFPVGGMLPEGLYQEGAHQESLYSKGVYQESLYPEGVYQERARREERPPQERAGLHIRVTVRRPSEEPEGTHQERLYTGGSGGAAERTRGNTVLRLIPRCLCLGVGCRKDAAPEQVKSACDEFLRRQGIAPEAIGMIASIALKEREPALLALREHLSASFSAFSAEALQTVSGSFESSSFVAQITGVGNVCERAAAAVYSAVLVKKTVVEGVTFALSQETPILYFREETDTKEISAETINTETINTETINTETTGAEEDAAEKSSSLKTGLEAVSETRLILVTGGAFQGKRRFAEELSKRQRAEGETFFTPIICEVTEELLAPLAARLREDGEKALRETAAGICGDGERARIVILRTEGNGVVPVRASERAQREVRGRLGCLLAEAAEEVWELNCGIPRRLK